MGKVLEGDHRLAERRRMLAEKTDDVGAQTDPFEPRQFPCRIPRPLHVLEKDPDAVRATRGQIKVVQTGPKVLDFDVLVRFRTREWLVEVVHLPGRR